MRSQSGFTLLEVLAALAISTAAVMLSMRTVDFIKTAQSRGQNYSRAHGIAMTVIEQLMSTFPTDASLSAGTHTQLYDHNGQAVAAMGQYTARWDVTPDDPITKVIKIQVYVMWSENGSQRTVTFLTYRPS